MNRIRFDSHVMGLINVFESQTGAPVKDCIADEKLIFVIEEGQMGKAIGKAGVNIKKMEHAFKKKIKLIEYSSDIVQFVRNYAYPSDVQVEKKDKLVIIHAKDTATRAMIIGRERQNLNQMLSIIKRYFDVDEIKVM